MSDPTSPPPSPAGRGDVDLEPTASIPTAPEQAASDPTASDPTASERAAVALLDPAPRPGELTSSWRIGIAMTWIAVVLALAAVWNASVQLGLSTWWLGPRGDPRPRVIQLLPFVAPMLMLLGTINNLRWLGWYGLVASGVLAAIGIGDIPTVGSIAATELAIAGAAAAISLASLTGTYRAPAERPEPPASPPR